MVEWADDFVIIPNKCDKDIRNEKLTTGGDAGRMSDKSGREEVEKCGEKAGYDKGVLVAKTMAKKLSEEGEDFYKIEIGGDNEVDNIENLNNETHKKIGERNNNNKEKMGKDLEMIKECESLRSNNVGIKKNRNCCSYSGLIWQMRNKA